MRKVENKPKWIEQADFTKDQYKEWYHRSVTDPNAFWMQQAQRLQWRKPFQTGGQWDFTTQPPQIQWFKEGQLNICENCIDRHLEHHADKVAFYWEPDNPSQPGLSVTYQQLSENVNRLANALKQTGVKKGDRITIYLPMIPEAIYSLLACARIGAVHSVVFAGFSPSSLADRINDCDSDYLITADEGLRGGKTIPLKQNADLAIEKCERVKKVFVVRRTGAPVNWFPERDVWYHEEVERQSTECPAVSMNAEDPLFILYTSGSTNKPKGILHTSGGYLTYVSLSHRYVFNIQDHDVYWCAADIGWITGHSYIVYGPFSNATTQVLFEGVPTSPTASRIWEIVDKYQVSILYTAPTLIRALMVQGDEPLKTTQRRSLRILGSVGEPINPEAWQWYYEVAGNEQAPVVDTWWQTETGGIMITPLPGVNLLKPGAATMPFFSIQPVILDAQGNEQEGAAEGVLAIKSSWPGQMRGIYKDPERFHQVYFQQYPGYYFTGDGCRRDEEGDYWITGRVDDVINVSGHRMGTAEIESALVEHEAVCEAAVVGFSHKIKGQGIYAYVTLEARHQPNEGLKAELNQLVRDNIGKHAHLDFVHLTPALPKTRSGKIMRRILRKIAEGQFDQMGDTSTLADPEVVGQLIQQRQMTLPKK